MLIWFVIKWIFSINNHCALRSERHSRVTCMFVKIHDTYRKERCRISNMLFFFQMLNCKQIEKMLSVIGHRHAHKILLNIKPVVFLDMCTQEDGKKSRNIFIIICLFIFFFLFPIFLYYLCLLLNVKFIENIIYLCNM